MQVILQGALRVFPLGELLPFVCRLAASGTLEVAAAGEGGRRTRIVFAKERVIWAESAVLGGPAEGVLDALTWPDGSFALVDAASVPADATPVALELQPLLDEAKRRAEAAAGYADSTLFRVVDDPALQQQVSLTAEEFKLLFRLAAGKTFKDLMADLALPRPELSQRLKRLEDAGLVAATREAAAPKREVTAAPVDLDKTTFSAKPAPAAGARHRTLVGSLTPDGAPDSVWPLLDEESSIGRLPSNAISISDGSVSSKHARIVRTAEGFVLEDLQSRNGTFVNGERITEKRLLVDGDLIRLGKIILTFNVARELKPGETTQPEVRLS